MHRQMPRILFLSQALPFPPESGGTQRSFHVLRELQKGFDVSLVAFSRRKHQPTQASREEAERGLSAYVDRVFPSVPLPAEHSRLRRLWDHGRSLLTGKAYSVFQYRDDEFTGRVAEAVAADRPDLVHLDSFDLFPWADRFAGTPVACTHHDVESHLLRRRARTARNRMLSAYIRHQASLVERVEAEYCPRFDLNLTMSELDSQRILGVAPEARVREAPNAVDLDTFRPPDPGSVKSNSVTFVGPTYLFANADAVQHLLGDIWPRVRRLNPDATLTLVGRNAPGERDSFAAIPGVEPLGRVEDIRPHLGATACSVIPIRVGGGTRIKILESWALGRAVVTTTLGCEGLEVTDGVNALVRDEPEQFAAAVAEVLDKPDLRDRLGRAGRDTVEKKYAWSQVGASIRQHYAALIKGGSPTTANKDGAQQDHTPGS